MTVDNSIRMAETDPVILPTDYILVEDAEFNSPQNREMRKREMRKLLGVLCTEHVTMDSSLPTYDISGRKITLGAAALVQLGSKEDNEPSIERVSRQLNEVLPFVGAIQEPPVTPEPVTVEQVGQWLSDANANLAARTRAQPYDISAWTYYSRIQGLQNGSLIFADQVATRQTSL